MQENKLLTIVIPAYNMEKYLHRCLNSILVENLMDLVQIIVVNDGSRDKTSEIAHRYEQQYPRYIQVIDKKNGNYGSCMNAGLAHAEGKYFRTLDADDWYDTFAYEKFVMELEKTDADMVVTEYYKHDEGTGNQVCLPFEKTLDTTHDILIIRQLWDSETIMSHMHVYCISYKTSVLRSSGMKWSENVFYSDNEYIYWPLSCIKTIRFVPLPVYIYLIGRNEQSVSLSSLKRNFHSYDVVTNKVLDHYLHVDHTSVTEPLAKSILLKLLCRFYNTLLYNGTLKKKNVMALEAKLKQDKQLYYESGKVTDFRGHYFIEYFRNSKFKYYLCRLDYMMRSNVILIFFRNIYK